MSLCEHCSQPFDGHMGVPLCRRKGCMAKHFLNRPKICAALQNVGSSRMTQGMRGQ